MNDHCTGIKLIGIMKQGCPDWVLDFSPGDFRLKPDIHWGCLRFLYLCLIIVFLNIFSITPAESQVTNTEELIALGKEVYNMKGCSGCHKIAGAGGDLGPDLTNEGNIVSHDIEWHKKHFRDPQSVVPGSTMPKIDLTEMEIEALTAFMASLKSAELPKDIEGAIRNARERLDEARKGIDEIKAKGFNVDDLEIRYAQGWTHLETINNMIYTHNLTGVYQETEAALNMAKEIMQEVHSYRKELEHRIIQAIILIALLVIIVVLVFIKLLIV